MREHDYNNNTIETICAFRPVLTVFVTAFQANYYYVPISFCRRPMCMYTSKAHTTKFRVFAIQFCEMGSHVLLAVCVICSLLSVSFSPSLAPSLSISLAPSLAIFTPSTFALAIDAIQNCSYAMWIRKKNVKNQNVSICVNWGHSSLTNRAKYFDICTLNRFEYLFLFLVPLTHANGMTQTMARLRHKNNP